MRILEYFNVWKPKKQAPPKAVFINKEQTGDSCKVSLIASIKAKSVYAVECHKEKTIYIDVIFDELESDIFKIPLDNKFTLNLITPGNTIQVDGARVNMRIYNSETSEWLIKIDAAFPELI